MDAPRRRLAGFLALLRHNGFPVGPAEAADALRAMAALDLSRPAPLRQALRHLLCGRRTEWQRFDALFDAHWLGLGVRQAVRVTGSPPPGGRGVRTLMDLAAPRGTPDGMPDRVERGLGAEAPGGGGRRGGAAAAEAVERRDLRTLRDPEELARAHALAERLARRLLATLTRRMRRAREGRVLDLRATIRRSVGRGGEPIDRLFRRRRPQPLGIVLILDVSGSMEPYTAFFVRFMHAMLLHVRRAEAFVFHTRLIHVSPALADRDPGRAVDRLSLIARGWSGGTRIGACLAAFNREHAPRAVDGRTAVILFSDGYDTGEPERLAREMAALRRRTRRIVWLNPMAGWRGYAPEAAGMRAALPYVDLFAPAHSLDSLSALEPYLARI
ncbi:vWA domain-containing protein [Azospirillum sp. ST 5-10]|uniref:vWA domain-containing protein n=1 Tax=unclassified Azospirillum TaxID=2630922 RepID=UPI003F49DEEA